MANYKINIHYLPWELDYALLNYTQLKKSKYYLNLGEDNIYIDSTLNLSNHIIDWDKSQLPKEFFKKKFENLAPLLKDFNFRGKVYEGNELYGHLDTQREMIESNIDYYITFCPDMYFGENLLYYLIEGSKQIKNKYFVLTPQIPKMWDYTWDGITNEEYRNHPSIEWNNIDIFDIRWNNKNNQNEIKLSPINEHKWAGWFELSNKAFYEELVPIRSEWKGYGPYDYYSMLVTQYAKNKGIDFQQWVVENQVIFEYSVGPLKENGFSKCYKDLITLKDIPNQRLQFESNMSQYIQEWKILNKFI